MRQTIKAFFGAGLLLTGITAAYANPDYPARPITLYVPYSAGGVTDVVTRGLAKHLGDELGQSVVIENKTGANGTMGAMQLLNAKPDGYTLSVAPIGLFRMPFMMQTSYDPSKDFTYISMFAGFNYVIAVNAESPWQTVGDLVRYAKENKNKISYGTPGAYSSQHLAMVQLGQEANVQWTHIPFKGDADALSNLLGKNIDAVVGATTVLPHVKAGKIRVLATLGDKPNADFPGVPSLKEAGYPVVHTSPIGIIGPAGMDEAVVAKLDASIREAIENPDMQQLLRAQGLGSGYLSHEEYEDYAKRTLVSERPLIEGLKKLLEKE